MTAVRQESVNTPMTVNRTLCEIAQIAEEEVSPSDRRAIENLATEESHPFVHGKRLPGKAREEAPVNDAPSEVLDLLTK